MQKAELTALPRNNGPHNATCQELVLRLKPISIKACEK